MNLKKIFKKNLYLIFKRNIDILISLLILLLSSPLLIIISLLIKKEDGGAIFFFQTREGKNGKLFYIYKFRSMRTENQDNGDGTFDPQRESLLEARERYKTTDINDARFTKIGKIIRKYHIDEIPQVINVIKNQMSIVGPRPHVPAQRADYDNDQWKLRTSVKPGITGLSQVKKTNSQESSDFLDYKYIREKSIILDLSIIFRTIGKVLFFNSF